MLALTFVVPCRNEQEVLPQSLPRLLAAGAADGAFEVILIDDGSTDGTWALIAAAAAEHPQVRGLRFTANFGQHAAIFAGLEHARGDHVLLVDVDLQDPPELAAPMLARAREGFDIVTGVRRSRAGESWPKRATAWAFHRAFALVAPRPVPLDSGYFHLLSRRAVDALLALPARDRHLRLLVSLIDLPRITFPYDRAPRLAGHTHYSYARLCGVAWHAFASCLQRPSADAGASRPLYGLRETAPPDMTDHRRRPDTGS